MSCSARREERRAGGCEAFCEERQFNRNKKKTTTTPLFSIEINRRIRVMKKWFHVFFKNRWGRGQPDDIGAINLGDEKFDPDSDKKPRAGQILWIRGLTRLQTQVTIPISLSLSSFLFSFSFSHYLITLNKINILSIIPLSRKQKEIQQATATGFSRFGWRVHLSHIYGPFNVNF